MMVVIEIIENSWGETSDKKKKIRKIHLLSRGPDSPLKLILLNVLL